MHWRSWQFWTLRAVQGAASWSTQYAICLHLATPCTGVFFWSAHSLPTELQQMFKRDSSTRRRNNVWWEDGSLRNFQAIKDQFHHPFQCPGGGLDSERAKCCCTHVSNFTNTFHTQNISGTSLVSVKMSKRMSEPKPSTDEQRGIV